MAWEIQKKKLKEYSKTKTKHNKKNKITKFLKHYNAESPKTNYTKHVHDVRGQEHYQLVNSSRSHEGIVKACKQHLVTMVCVSLGTDPVDTSFRQN